MFFSNETRVADTATPNNFTVGSSDPNVGQYGWTKEDRGNYNQLIQYVEECRGVVDQVTEMATYIEELARKMTGITSVYEDILRIQKALSDLETSFQIDFDDFKTKYDNFLVLYGAFNSTYQDFLVKYQEVLTAAAEAKSSADAAKLSETKAKSSEGAAASSAKDAADIAEELRKGQVYRGSWNIEANAGYPTAPDTNSVWDIALNEGSLQFSFDGKTWFWGDRLLYLKDDNKFSQIESGSTVVSVNGKSGAVTLNAQDVGALTFLHPLQSTMPPGFFVGQMGLNNDSGAPTSGSQGFILKGDTGSNAFEGALAWGYGDGVFSLGQKHPGNPWSWNRVYHEGFKPTTADVGAVNKLGDTMTGPLTVAAGLDGVSMYASTEGATLVNAKTGTQLTIGNDDALRYKGGRVYHEGFKPTPADIGAFPMTGGTLNGPVNSGAYGVSFKSVGGGLRSNDTTFLSLDGNTYSFLTSPSDAHLCQNSYWNGVSWLKHNNEQPSGHLFISHGALRFTQSDAGTPDPLQRANYVYHTGYKPTAEDVGAPIKGKIFNNKSDDLDHYWGPTNIGMWSVEGAGVANWPWNNVSAGYLVIEAIDGFTKQVASRGDSYDTVCRFRSGISGGWSKWEPVYNGGYTPTRLNWSNFETKEMVSGGITWNNYGNGHSIIDASSGVAPDGKPIDAQNPQEHWAPSFPTLVGWNGERTYGVRVDSSRVSHTSQIANYSVVHDLRTTPTTPQSFENNTSSFWFSNSTTDSPKNVGFFSGINIRGWSEDYSNWQLVSGADSPGIMGSDSALNKLWFRNSNGVNWNPYQEVYTSGNKPTARDIGTIPVSSSAGEWQVQERRLASGEVRVANDGGLRFSPTESFDGVSWGVGMDAAGSLNFHKYQDAAWVSAPLQIASNGTLLAGGSPVLTSGQNILNNASFGPGFITSADTGKPWIASYFGTLTGPKVVMGTLGGIPSIAAHSPELTEWDNLFINCGASVSPDVSVVINDPQARVKGDLQNYKIYHEGFRPTARDINISNPLTKDVEILSDVIASLREELASLRAEVQALKGGTLES